MRDTNNDSQTELGAFAADEASTSSEDEPTAVQNAVAINQLTSLLQDLTSQMETINAELNDHETEQNSEVTIDSDPTGMFH
ncbi:hypothetical protein [Haloarcula onubensis]|uniref:Uncharacterized protein n=1 Tax=Haloarcula onubensis TaxID=2950539 RepID=A0ABU2FVE9_9EURY|nr:hypothetical protein [Halomicroarcula sp. S3CR25-11]MDS0284735.1 hypothetical protein [Halomicroarcula sp. S3CR25-11]